MPLFQTRSRAETPGQRCDWGAPTTGVLPSASATDRRLWARSTKRPVPRNARPRTREMQRPQAWPKCRTAMVAGHKQRTLSVSGGRLAGASHTPALWCYPYSRGGGRRAAGDAIQSAAVEHQATVLPGRLGTSRDGRLVIADPQTLVMRTRAGALLKEPPSARLTTATRS